MLSLKVTLCASLIAMLLGGSLAWWMSRVTFKGKVLLETCFMLPLVLPPTVIGFLLLSGLGRKSMAGRLIESLFHAPVVFTWWATVIAAATVAFPLVYQTMKAGFLSIDADLVDAGRSIGANEWQVLRHIMLPLSSQAIFTAYILGFARALGEFGATMMFAGNIPGRTQTLPTAIYVATDTGQQGLAWAWTIMMIIISFLMLLMARARSAHGMRS